MKFFIKNSPLFVGFDAKMTPVTSSRHHHPLASEQPKEEKVLSLHREEEEEEEEEEEDKESAGEDDDAIDYDRENMLRCLPTSIPPTDLPLSLASQGNTTFVANEASLILSTIRHNFNAHSEQQIFDGLRPLSATPRIRRPGAHTWSAPPPPRG